MGIITYNLFKLTVLVTVFSFIYSCAPVIKERPTALKEKDVITDFTLPEHPSYITDKKVISFNKDLKGKSKIISL